MSFFLLFTLTSFGEAAEPKMVGPGMQATTERLSVSGTSAASAWASLDYLRRACNWRISYEQGPFHTANAPTPPAPSIDVYMPDGLCSNVRTTVAEIVQQNNEQDLVLKYEIVGDDNHIIVATTQFRGRDGSWMPYSSPFAQRVEWHGAKGSMFDAIEGLLAAADSSMDDFLLDNPTVNYLTNHQVESKRRPGSVREIIHEMLGHKRFDASWTLLEHREPFVSPFGVRHYTLGVSVYEAVPTAAE